jgi:hypothetical protein
MFGSIQSATTRQEPSQAAESAPAEAADVEAPEVAEPAGQAENEKIAEYQAKEQELAAELAELEGRKAELENQINAAADAKAQLELERTLTEIEIERQNRQSQLDTIRAQSNAEAAKYQAAIDAINIQSTQTAEIEAAKAQDEIERLDARNQQKMMFDKALFGGLQVVVFMGIVAAAIVLYLVVGWFYREGRAKHARNMIAIRQAAPETVQHQRATSEPNDIQSKVSKMLSKSIAWWNAQSDEDGPVNGREQIQIPSYDKLGMSGADWTELTDYLVSLHVLEKKSGPGNGAKFAYGNLHEWKLAAMNGRLGRVDPLKINTPTPPPL